MRGVMLAALWAGVGVMAAGQAVPLPDQATFFAELRSRVADTRLREDGLAYNEHSPELRLNPVGRMGTGPIVVAEVYPFPELDLTYRRVLERGGRPVDPSELAAQDRRFLSRLADARRKVDGGRERRIAEAQSKEAAIQRDVFDTLEFSIEDREDVDGQPAIRVRFAPRRDVRPRTREGRVAAGFSGMIWIHEVDYEVMRIVGDAIDDVSFGFGVIGRLHRGSHFETRRLKVDGVWVTGETAFRGTGRALLFRRIELDYRREYTNYRRFDPAQFEAMLARQ